MQSGVCFLVLAMLLTPAVDGVAKTLTADHSPMMIAFLRYFCAGLIALMIAPIVVFVALSFRRIARKMTTQARRVLAEVNANVQESITGIAVAKNFRQEQRIYDEFKPVNAQTYYWSLRQGLTFSSIFPILGVISGVGTALIVTFGGDSGMLVMTPIFHVAALALDATPRSRPLMPARPPLREGWPRPAQPTSVPEQDLDISFARLPALPRDHFVISDVQLAQ